MGEFEIPREEVRRMRPEEFVECYTYCGGGLISWIQHNKRIGGDVDLRGLRVWADVDVWEEGGWNYSLRDKLYFKHYRTLEDLVEGCDNGELLALFLKEV